MKHYAIVEIFNTFQGEGTWAGRRAVFLRFAGCNMWNGHPEDRHKGAGACAQWCDTNFVGGEKLSADEIVARLEAAWGELPYGRDPIESRMVVMTGGEPTLQLDGALVAAIKGAGWFTAIETNGTIDNPALNMIDHVCVSPKRGSELAVWQAHELKVVLPGGAAGAPTAHHWSQQDLRQLAVSGQWRRLYVQPQDVTTTTEVEHTYLHSIRKGAHRLEVAVAAQAFDDNVRACLEFLKENPRWLLSLQQHKYLGLR